jgi:hypothetical protein
VFILENHKLSKFLCFTGKFPNLLTGSENSCFIRKFVEIAICEAENLNINKNIKRNKLFKVHSK